VTTMQRIPTLPRPKVLDEPKRQTLHLVLVYAGVVLLDGLLFGALLGLAQWAGLMIPPVDEIIPSAPILPLD
jgi:hypothetical protein